MKIRLVKIAQLVNLFLILGFILKDGKCVQGVDHCREYDEKNNCKHCARGYSLVLDQCLDNYVLGCKT